MLCWAWGGWGGASLVQGAEEEDVEGEGEAARGGGGDAGVWITRVRGRATSMTRLGVWGCEARGGGERGGGAPGDKGGDPLGQRVGHWGV